MNLFVSGGASGLGEAITRRLASNTGNQIWFTYFSSRESAASLSQTFPNVTPIECDLRDPLAVTRMIAEMDGMELEGIVNNALPVRITRNHFHKLEPKVFMDGFNGSIIPTTLLTQKAITLFRKRKKGRIVSILSSAVAGKLPVGYSEYAAAKAYLHSLARAWAVENAAFGITSNCVSPGFMATRLNAATDERVVQDMIARHPLRRLLEPLEVAEAVEFFLTCSPHINGNNLIVNAGQDLA